MAKFKFRLEKLLEYRRLQEKWAKEAYLEALARRVETEHEVEQAKRHRAYVLQAKPCGLDERVSLDAYVTRLEDELRAAESALAVLANETESALQEWHRARSDSEAMEKLRQRELEFWTQEQNRREQTELDEWAVLRRAA